MVLRSRIPIDGTPCRWRCSNDCSRSSRRRDDPRRAWCGSKARAARSARHRPRRGSGPRRLGDLLELLSQAMRSIRGSPRWWSHGSRARRSRGMRPADACDFRCGEPGTRLGYPVPRVDLRGGLGADAAGDHRTLEGAFAAARSLGARRGDRLRPGPLTHFAQSLDRLTELVETLRDLAAKGPEAMRRTKAWLNELDGSIDDARHERALACSVSTTGTRRPGHCFDRTGPEEDADERTGDRELVEVASSDGVTRVRLNRPEVRTPSRAT